MPKLLTQINAAIRANIRYKLFLIYLLSISVPIIIFGTISYQMSSHIIESDYIKYKERINRQIIENIDDNINNLKKQSMAVYTNHDEILYILNTNTDKLDVKYLEAYKKVYKNFVSILQSSPDLFGITLISLEGEVKFYCNRQVGQINLTRVRDEPWFRATLRKKGFPILRAPHHNEFDIDKNIVISISRAVVNLYNDRICGVLIFDQSIHQFSRFFANLETEPGEIITVYGGDGKLIYSNANLSGKVYGDIFNVFRQRTPPARFVLSGQPMLAKFNQSAETGWTVISLTPRETLQKKSHFIREINYYLILILILFTFVISIVASTLITIPLNRLMASFKKLQGGDFTTSVPVKGRDELAQIGITFNNMVANIKSLIRQKFEMGLQRKQAELESLQSQINPHFLFNTLNSIKAVNERRDFVKTAAMIQNLSDIFRYSLNRGVYIVKFGDELEHIKKYLEIQAFRFGDRYQVTYDIDREALDCQIPRLTLQPIVENALYHGLEPSIVDGRLQIAAQVVADRLIIYISNNGIPISEAELANINNLLESNPDSQANQNPEKLGIYNVNARIKFHFGNEYGLKISSSPGSGTTVRITLPAAWAAKEASP